MSVDNAVKGLAVLTAIPVVLLALWADYFGRALLELEKKNPHYDRAAEHFKLRLAGLGAMFFQFGIFMGSAPVRKDLPVAANLLFVAAILLQSFVQAGVERKLRKPRPALRPVDPATQTGDDADPSKDVEIALRAFFWATLGGALYLAGFALPVLIVAVVSKFIHASAPLLTALVIGSAVVGMIAGVGINFALGAFYLRRMLPAREITDASFKERLQKCFTSAGLPSPSLWIIETGRSREATAMMAGFPWGRGFFRPGLFLSRALVDALTPEELRAVVLHEVSHLKLQHLRKRLTYSISLVVGTTTAATFCVFLAGVFLPGSDLRDFIGFAAAAGAFVLTFRLLGKQSRGHEHEADFYSVGALKAGVEDLVNALRKLDIINGRTGSANKNPIATAGIQGHPATELRVVALRERFASTESAATAAHEESDRAA